MSWFSSHPQTENEKYDMANPDPREMATTYLEDAPYCELCGDRHEWKHVTEDEEERL